MTADEYLALGETPEKYELIDGVVFMSPSPTPRHQLLCRFLLRELDASAAGRSATIVPDIDLLLDTGKVYRPDIVVFAPGRFAKLPERFALPPDLIVEIISPGSKPLDLITKRDDYDAFGVGEYWVIDPQDVSTRIWRRSAGSSARMLEVSVDRDAIDCVSVPGLKVNLAAVRKALG